MMATINDDKMVDLVSSAAVAILEGREFNFTAASSEMTDDQIGALALEAFTARVNKVITTVQEIARAA